MALRFFWRCEGTTLDGTHDYSAGDTTAAATNSPAIDAAAARVGTNGILIDAANESYRFDTATIASDLTSEGSFAFSIRVTTAPATTPYPVMIRGSSFNDYITLRLNNGWGSSTGTLTVEQRSNTSGGVVSAALSGSNLTTNTWYGVVVRWDQVAGLIRIEVYDASGALITGTTNSAGFVAMSGLSQSDGIRIGEVTGSAPGTYHLDNFFIADAYDEPLEDYLDITSYTEYGGGGFQSAWARNSNQVIT